MVQGQVEAKSLYNPLDLYGPDPAAQRRAVGALLRSPQNNLVVHVRGARSLPLRPVNADLDLQHSWPDLHAVLVSMGPADMAPAELLTDLVLVRTWSLRHELTFQ
jgi:Inositol-pentakisphosphate 2-kinase